MCILKCCFDVKLTYVLWINRKTRQTSWPAIRTEQAFKKLVSLHTQLLLCTYGLMARFVSPAMSTVADKNVSAKFWPYVTVLPLIHWNFLENWIKYNVSGRFTQHKIKFKHLWPGKVHGWFVSKAFFGSNPASQIKQGWLCREAPVICHNSS